PGGRPWTLFADPDAGGGELELPWTERGVVVCGDGDYDALALVELAGQAGWPVLAEPSSGARRGPNALTAYQYLLATPGFLSARPGRAGGARRARPGARPAPAPGPGRAALGPAPGAGGGAPPGGGPPPPPAPAGGSRGRRPPVSRGKEPGWTTGAGRTRRRR